MFSSALYGMQIFTIFQELVQNVNFQQWKYSQLNSIGYYLYVVCETKCTTLQLSLIKNSNNGSSIHVISNCNSETFAGNVMYSCFYKHIIGSQCHIWYVEDCIIYYRVDSSLIFKFNLLESTVITKTCETTSSVYRIYLCIKVTLLMSENEP